MPTTYLYDKNYEQKKSAKLKGLDKYLSRDIFAKLRAMVVDAKSFNQTFFEIKSPKTLDFECVFERGVDKSIVLVYKFKNIKSIESIDSNKKHQIFIDGKVCFWGDGKWGYEIQIKDGEDLTKIEFYGVAKKLNVGSDPSASGYVFVLSNDAEKFLSLPEVFFENWGPIIGVSSKMSLKDSSTIKISWISDYYDGPLSGYCMYKDKLHFFSMVEEQEYSGRRMYGIYPVGLINKMRAYFRHFLWEVFIPVLPNSIKGKLWYGFLGPLTKFKETKLLSKPAIGFFEY